MPRYILIAALLAACHPKPQTASAVRLDVAAPPPSWSVYGGDPGGMRYAPLEQIRPDNIDNLAPAWIYHR